MGIKEAFSHILSTFKVLHFNLHDRFEARNFIQMSAYRRKWIFKQLVSCWFEFGFVAKNYRILIVNIKNFILNYCSLWTRKLFNAICSKLFSSTYLCIYLYFYWKKDNKSMWQHMSYWWFIISSLIRFFVSLMRQKSLVACVKPFMMMN